MKTRYASMATSAKWFAVYMLAACASDDVPREDDPPSDASQRFTVTLENVAPWTVLKSGTQAKKTTGAVGPLAPLEMYEITFTAGTGHAISFATMLGESNDWFFAPGPAGLMLYDERGQPISGDVTRYIQLWDAGTEVDQEPAVGAATAPQQPAPNYGAADPQPGVKELRGNAALDNGAAFALPAVPAMIKVMLTPGPNRTFTLTIQNCSTPSTLVTSNGPRPIHLSPLAWSVHALPEPLFAVGAAASPGLERIAEDGMPDVAGSELAATTGYHTPLSPGVFVVTRELMPLFTTRQRDRGEGLERIAEDGDPSQLATRTTGAFATPVGASAPGAAMPGQRYTFELVAAPGDQLSLATMYGMSNDWFFAAQDVALFDGDQPRAVELTGDVALYDAGTELDQEIAVGPDTAPQQRAPNTGAVDPDATVREVTTYATPVAAHLRLTLTPH